MNPRGRISPSTAVMSASTLLGAIAGGLAWPTAGPSVALFLMVFILCLGAGVVVIGRWFEDQWARRQRGRAAAARQRRGPPLPSTWEVPDYPPDDLRPPAL